jgi:hypothetical protein
LNDNGLRPQIIDPRRATSRTIAATMEFVENLGATVVVAFVIEQYSSMAARSTQEPGPMV